MKATIYSIEGKALKQVDLPGVFDSPQREDLVKRAVLSEESEMRQPKGSYPFAGMETSARYRGRKDDFGTVKNRGIPHQPHEVLPNGQLGRVKRIPTAVKGRRAHPPKVTKKYVELINKKEHRLALASALAFSTNRDVVSKRCHAEVGPSIPIVMEAGFEKLKRTKDVMKLLESLKLDSFVEKSRKNGTKSMLMVVSEGSVLKAASNIPGVDVVRVSELKVRHLAPGTHPGRITLYSENALPELAKRFEA
jgi:large subunit ribosomal protein L4e